MKQYTTPEQTAKLIELGFEKPKTIVDKYYDFDAEDYKEVNHYSIGELIGMLPPRYNGEDLTIWRDWRFERWLVGYRGDDAIPATELIYALYDMVVKLKEEGVI